MIDRIDCNINNIKKVKVEATFIPVTASIYIVVIRMRSLICRIKTYLPIDCIEGK